MPGALALTVGREPFSVKPAGETARTLHPAIADKQNIKKNYPKIEK